MADASQFIKIIGADEVIKDFESLKKNFQKKVAKAGITAGTAEIRKVAKRKAPKRPNSGILKGNIRSIVGAPKKGQKGVIGRIGHIFKSKKNVEYYVDQKTKNRPEGAPVLLVYKAQNKRTNFLESALNEAQGTAIAKAKAKVYQQMDKIMGKY